MERKMIIFTVFGRLGDSLVVSKLLPIIELNIFDEIFAFKETDGPILPNVRYVTKPQYLTQRIIKLKFVDRVMELYQLIIKAITIRPQIINGYQLVPKGINSFIASKLSGSFCMISSIGGIPEINTYMKPGFFWKRLNIFILKNSDLVTTKGETVTNYIQALGVQPAKIHTFNGAIDPSIYNNDSAINRDIDLLFVGRFTTLKGPDRFVAIIDKLSKKYPDIQGVMLGHGELFDQIKNQIYVRGLHNNIHLLGFKQGLEIYYKRSKMLVMPSVSEGLSTAMIEAMACGCVPIVSNVGCQSEAAKNRENALLIDNYNDIDSFFSGIEWLFQHKYEWKRMSQNAIISASKEYSIVAQADVYKRILQSNASIKRLLKI